MSEQFGEDLILIERLAFGGMAEVFLAKNVGHGGFEKTVAVKRILPQYNSRPDFQRMFEREMKICAHLQHPNIVQIYRNGIWNEYLYLVMEFVNGKTVLKLLETAEATNEFIPIAVACYIVREAARGLQYAHDCVDPISGEHLSIVHRDISPHNLMVTYTGEVKILDFGIARAADTADLTRTGELKGKIPYMSPEVIEGAPPTRRSDIFSLGVVLYELLAIRRLFAGGSTFQTMRKIREAEIPPLTDVNPDVPQELEYIVYRMLARDEVQRYQNASEVERDLTNYMQRAFPNFNHSEVSGYLNYLYKDQIADERKSRAVRMSSTVIQEPPPNADPEATRAITKRPTTEYESQFSGATVIDSGFHRDTATRWWLSAVLLASIVVTIIFGLVERKRDVQSQPQRPPVKAIDPGVVPGLIGWFNPDQIELGDRSPIERWVSRTSTLAQAVQLDPSAQPLLKKNGLNGHAVVSFDGYRQFLTVDDLRNSLINCSERSIFYVAATMKSGTQYVISAHAEDKLSDIFRVGFADARRARIKQDPNGARYEDSGVIDGSTFGYYSAFFEPSRAQLFRNGSLLIDAPVRGGNYKRTTYLSIGQEWDGEKPSDFFGGDLGELLIYCRRVTEEERLGIERYLSDLYTIAPAPVF